MERLHLAAVIAIITHIVVSITMIVLLIGAALEDDTSGLSTWHATQDGRGYTYSITSPTKCVVDWQADSYTLICDWRAP